MRRFSPLGGLCALLSMCACSQPLSAADTISTVGGGGPSGLAATSANIPYPVNTAIDNSGSYYIVVQNTPTQHRVFKVNSSGTLTVFAGSGALGYSGDGGQAAQAQLNFPQSVALDSSGNVYIADSGNCVIRKVTMSGVISTFAGTPQTCGFAGDGGSATQAQLNYPQGVAVDSSNNIYIADTTNQRIRKVSASNGDISTVAGNGTNGYSGDGGAATKAELNYPSAVAVGPSRLFIADNDNYRIRAVTFSTGNIATIAGNGNPGSSGNGGTATSAEINFVYGIALDSGGHLFIADPLNCEVRELSGTTITEVAGNHTCGYKGDGGAAASAELNEPYGVAVDSSDNLYIADFDNLRVRKVSASSGDISTIAGNGTIGYASTSSAMGSSLNVPSSAIPNAAGDTLYVADQQNCLVRQITSSDSLVTLAGKPGVCSFSGNEGAATSATLDNPYKAVLDSAGNIYIADTNNCQIRKVSANSGQIAAFAGSGTCGYSGDGASATKAELLLPEGITLDPAGNLYIADTGNNVIRKVTISSGIISTIAGDNTAGPGYSGDGGAATGAQLNSPADVAVSATGNIYIADSYNDRIRVVTLNGIINTLAGNGNGSYDGDGIPAYDASLSSPSGVSVDVAGDVLISDSYNNRIRYVNGAGYIYTVVGNGNFGFSGDYGVGTAASLATPLGAGVDSFGNIYVADSSNLRIRQVTAVPNLNASAYNVTFPQQAVGTTSSPEVVTLQAVGSVTISSITATGDFTEGNNCSSSLSSGASCRVDVLFTPSASGTRTGSLTVATNGFFTPTVKINLTGTGQGLSYSPEYVSFGSEPSGGASATHTVTFTNQGSTAVSFSSASTTNSMFAIRSNTCTSSLASKASCSIGVNFNPSATGSFTGTLVVNDSDNSSPQLIPLSGTGTTASTSASPQALKYGTVSKGAKSSLSSKVTNNGSSTLTSIKATVSGQNASDFTFTTTCGSTLAAKASCNYTVTFRPGATGARSGKLNIADSEGTFPVTLSGTGK